MAVGMKGNSRAAWPVIVIALAVGTVAGVLLHSVTTEFFIHQAEQNVEDILLQNKALHKYVQLDTHVALGQLKQEGELAQDFYCPEMLSSSYMIRHINQYLNEEREAQGLVPIRYRLAAVNPRNYVNVADSTETALIDLFNNNRALNSFRQIRDRDGQKYLYVAFPFLETNQACLRCHGDPSLAPRQLRSRYGDSAGFYADSGKVRAIEAVEVPVNSVYRTADFVFVGLLVAAVLVLMMVVLSNSLRVLVRRKSKQLQESEEKFRLVFEHSGDAHALIEDRAFTDCNQAALDMLGFTSSDQLAGKSPLDVAPEFQPDGRSSKEKMADMLTLVAEKGVVRFDWAGTTADGTQILADVVLSVMPHRGKQVIHAMWRDVTEVRRTTELLKKSEEKYRGLFELSPDPIVVLDRAGVVVSANRRLCDWLGIREENIKGKSFLEFPFIDSDDYPRLKRNHERRHAGDIVQPYLVTFHTPDGETRIAELTGTLAESPDRVSLIVIKDVTERLKAQQHITEQLEFLGTLLDTIPSPVYYKDREGRYQGCNKAFETFMGKPRREIIGKTVLDIGPSEIVDVHVQKDRELLANPGSIVYEWKALRHGDELRDVIFYKATFNHGDGVTAGIIGVLMDVTESRKVVEALRQSEERYRSLVESSNLGISLVTPDLKLLSANRRVREWFPNVKIGSGPVCHQMYGTGPVGHSCEHCPVSKALKDGRVHEIIVQRPLNDHEANLRVVATPVIGQDDHIVSVIETIEDVTERLRIEAELAKGQKLESLGVLAGGIAHDFNNILTAILGNLSLINLELPAGSDVVHLVEKAEQATERARDLTLQLLTFSKGGAPILKTASVAGLLRECAEFVLSGTSAKPEFELAEDLFAVDVDEGQISQVINNLVINANQAMPSGGVITLRAENAELTPDSDVPLAPGEYVRLEVVDHGIGIAEENLHRIFDPFFTTKETGNGLGLATSYAIIRKHGGHITVQSEVGVGTTFSIYLPASRRPGQIAGLTRNDAPAGHGRILVVDDEATIRNLAGAVLHKAGYEVNSTENGETAVVEYLKAFQSNQRYDAVILDLTMPGGMGGREVLARLRDIDPHVTAIVSSGYSNAPVLADFQAYGFAGCVAKPYRASDLIRVVAEVLKAVVEQPT